MDLLGAVKRYKNRLKRKYTKEITRKQFNFYCDSGITRTLRGLAGHLQCPVYCLCEHVLQIGLAEIAIVVQDPALKVSLERHLLKKHLLVDKLEEREPAVSKRLMRLQYATGLINCLDTFSSPERAKEVLERLIKEAIGSEQ